MKLELSAILNLYQCALSVLKMIPDDLRSQNHTAYLNELESRVTELKELIEYVQKGFGDDK